MNARDYETTDRIVGILIILTSLCGVCIGAGVMGLAAGIFAAGFPQDKVGASVGAGLASMAGLFIAGVYALNVAGGFGVMKGRRWGHLLTAILSSLTFLSGFSGHGAVTGLPSLAAAVYCILRLTGQLGTRPS